MLRRTLYLSGFLLTLMLLTSCPRPDLASDQAFVLFRQNRIGSWQWVKTVTPTRTLTPQLTGHTQTLRTSRFDADTLTFYQDQQVNCRLNPDQSTNLTNVIDLRSKTMLTSYLDSTQLHRYYIKFFFEATQKATTMQTSAPLVYLNPDYDTVRIYYRKQ
ncbi:hypothetical protein [Spirosoma endbachense]|uniref:Lipocalin-like domain-containing protein n=1 Tax=Spirosoma endbachense TaxID=2666025 RepID=A0A6P1W8M2_9BACT|nr:hypothetical protein [Spirosoma endbachense]QHW00261.1 hypothetical protein GJR95_36880 [Spirosoma endbachense]